MKFVIDALALNGASQVKRRDSFLGGIGVVGKLNSVLELVKG